VRKTWFELFWAKVDVNGPIPIHRPDLGPCWVWTACKSIGGYGRMQQEVAHRALWETTNGPIAEGYEPDHLCRNEACVRLSHMEVVTSRENFLRSSCPASLNVRKTHCARGHKLTGDNVQIKVDKTGKRGNVRVCVACRPYRLLYWQQYNRAKRETAK